MPGTADIMITLNGCFAVSSPHPDVMAPRSTKAKALLALVMSAPQAQRGRTWLQDKLWSDRAPEQGAASLRQSLSDIRRAFGSQKDCLIANKSTVALDLNRVALDQTTAGEFLEGIDVRDPEFEEWLTQERSARTNGPSNASPVSRPQRTTAPARLFFDIGGDASSPMGLIATLFADSLCLTLRETMLIETAHLTPTTMPHANDMVVVVRAVQTTEREAILRLSLEGMPDRNIHWSDHESTALDGAPPMHDLRLLALGNRLLQALSEVLSPQLISEPHQRDAYLIGQMAVRKIFTLRPNELQEADRLLTQAHDIDPKGLFLAWKAQLRLMQLVERHQVDPDTLMNEVEAYTEKALEIGQRNSMVLSLAAGTRLFLDRDANASYALAKRSVEINSANPMAWDAMSMTQLYRDDKEQAHLYAVKAQLLGKGSPYEFWWDMGRSLTAILTDRTEEAIQLMNQSSAFSPRFKAPLRYLAGLNAAMDNEADAVTAAARLRRLEPDFSFDKLTEDETYPTGLLRLQSPEVKKKIARFSD